MQFWQGQKSWRDGKPGLFQHTVQETVFILRSEAKITGFADKLGQ